jgi:hypothetical protein
VIQDGPTEKEYKGEEFGTEPPLGHFMTASILAAVSIDINCSHTSGAEIGNDPSILCQLISGAGLIECRSGQQHGQKVGSKEQFGAEPL